MSHNTNQQSHDLITVSAAELAAIFDEIDAAYRHSRHWGGEMRTTRAAALTQQWIANALASAPSHHRRQPTLRA